MASSASSTEEFDPKVLRRLLHSLRDSLVILAEWTDGLVEMVYDSVHIQLNNAAFDIDLVTMRFQAEVAKQVEALPGSAPTVKL